MQSVAIGSPDSLGHRRKVSVGCALALAVSAMSIACGSDNGELNVVSLGSTGGVPSGTGNTSSGGIATTMGGTAATMGGTATTMGGTAATMGGSAMNMGGGSPTGGNATTATVGGSASGGNAPSLGGTGTGTGGSVGTSGGNSTSVGGAVTATGGSSASAGSGVGGTSTVTTIPPGDGFYISGVCHPRCASAATDLDPLTGLTDGWGYENGASCIVVGSAPSLTAIPCIPPTAATGDGYLLVGTTASVCVPACTHPELADAAGYGYEAQQSCVVTGTTAALQNARCALVPRTLPPPGNGFLNGLTCYPPCSAGLAVDATGYGFEANRTCIMAGSTAAIQGLPCVPPPATVTGLCPATLTCPVVNGVTLQCGCTWVEGLAARKNVITGTAGYTQYFIASAMMETASLLADYALGDGKTGDAFNAGICKQNWGMMRRCHPAWSSMTADQFSNSTVMNSNLATDIQVYNECRTMFGTNWWSGHRAGYNNLGSNTQDIQEFKAAMDWTNTMLAGHLTDDVRFWVIIVPK